MKEKPKCSVMHSLCRGTKKSFLFFLFCMILFSAANINQCLRRKHQKKKKKEEKLIHLKLLPFHYQREDLKWASIGCSGQI